MHSGKSERQVGPQVRLNEVPLQKRYVETEWQFGIERV